MEAPFPLERAGKGMMADRMDTLMNQQDPLCRGDWETLVLLKDLRDSCDSKLLLQMRKSKTVRPWDLL